MKLIIALSLALSLLGSAPATGKDSDGHKLTKLWKELEKAHDADLPKDEMAILERIKEQAKEQKFAWDYYDASETYVRTGSRMDWKMRDSLVQAKRKDYKEFSEPIVWFYSEGSGSNAKVLKEYVEKNKAALKSARNPEFYTRDWRITRHFYSEALPALLESDYDYAMWCIEEPKVLSGLYPSYPLGAFAEYRQADLISDEARSLAAKREFAKKYSGKAVAMVAEGSLLSAKWDELQQDKKTTSAQYKAFADECRAYEKRRAAFSGNEALIVKKQQTAVSLLNSMESKGINMEIKDGRILMGLRNLDGVTVTVRKDSKTIYEKFLTNPKKSFYVIDEMMLEMPVTGDGTYEVTCSRDKTQAEQTYEKYTISAALKNIDGTVSVWAADYISGKPFSEISAELLNDGSVVKKARLRLDNGFAALPKDFSEKLSSDYSYSLVIRSAAHPARASKPVRPYHYYAPDLKDRPDRLNGIIIKDRSAFNPDETMHFKAIVYKGYYDFKAAAGLPCKVILLNAENKEISILQAVTNEFGSIDGSFVLKRGTRNGNYSIRLESNGKHICSESVMVDDFVLPTFDLIFDRAFSFYRPLEKAEVKGSIKAYSGHSLKNARISYSIVKSYNQQRVSDEPLSLDDEGRFCIPVEPDQKTAGYYESYYITVKVVDVTGETMEFRKFIMITDPPKPSYRTEFYFDEVVNEDGKLELKVVAGDKDTWLLSEIYGAGDKFLSGRVQKLTPTSGKARTTIKYELGRNDGDVATVKLLYFQDKRVHSYSATVRKVNRRCDLDLSFSRFLDTTAPKAQYSFSIKTAAGVECAATIFDKSTERFAGNAWRTVSTAVLPAPTVSYSCITGVNEAHYPIREDYLMLEKGAGAKAVMRSAAVSEEAAALDLSDSVVIGYNGKEPEGPDVELREDFATTIAWEPYLRSDDKGNINFTFTNADKLSTYYVQLFAHDKDMRNASLRREMLVTLPVKISLAEPRYLYEGDRYAARIGLSSSLRKDLRGTLSVSFLNGSDHRTAPVLESFEKKITVPGGGACDFSATCVAPEVEVLGIKAVFRPDDSSLGSDGVFVTVPVKKPFQTLGESHSGVVIAGADKAAIEKELRSRFVNIPGESATLREISILDMIKEALPEQIDYNARNSISIARALYADHLCEGLGHKTALNREEAISKLMACKGEDGGFSWFEGMDSSPLITAVVLRYLRGLGIVDETDAVKFIDGKFFNRDEKRWWYCGLSMEQYLAVRSLFPDVPLEQTVSKKMKKEAKEYLTPSSKRGLNGMIFNKARRLQTLENLLSSQQGIKLAKQFGVKYSSEKKLRKSLAADVASLVQYARPHRDGGCYYPNAVMPWRGLLESELDAHSSLCAIMDRNGHSDISNGIRIWIMLQKETQHWESDPGYVEAIGSVLQGSDEVLATSVLALSGEYTKEFSEIKATGNGISIKPASNLPDTLKVGDRVRLSFDIVNDENRSYVKLTIPYNAGLMPVNQISGYRWGSYRNVLADRIEYWYEVYPEEKTSVSEEFYVTRAGAFQCPAASIKCEYAPHYEANTAAPAVQTIE